MGFFGDLFGKSNEPEPELTIESSTIEPTSSSSASSKNRRGRGGGTEQPSELQQELDERQKAYDDYRQKILSGELGDEFGGGKGKEVLDELSRLDSLLKETQQKIADSGRDERDLGRAGGLGAGSAVGGALAGGNALASGVAGVGGAGLAGEALSEQPPFSSEGTLEQPTEFTIDTDDEEQEETILSADPEGEKGKLGEFLGNLFGRKKGDTELGMSGMTGEPLIPREETPTPTPTPTPTTTENNDLETTQEHHESTESATIQDQTLDFQHLGGSRSNFDSNFVGFILNYVAKALLNDLASRTTGLDEEWTKLIIDPAVDKVPELYRTIRDGISVKFNRLQLTDSTSKISKNKGNNTLTAGTLPLVIIIIYLYLVDRGSDFKFDLSFVNTYFLTRLLKSLGFDDELVNFGIEVFRKIPPELKTAYQRQMGSREKIIPSNEVNEIQKFVQFINREYFNRFKKNLANELFNFENKQSLYLYEMLETLHNSSTLFQISSAFNTLNELIVELVSNPYLLVQLFALLYSETENMNMSSSDILSRGKVDKYIYYYSDLDGGVKEDLKISVLKNVHLDMDKRGKVKGMTIIKNSDKVALYNYKGRYYITFRGTDPKDEKDIRSNFLNFGGKDLLNNPEYDQRIKIGLGYLKEAIELSRQQNLEPPIILGYSLGGISAMYLSTLYPNIETDVYAPIISKSELTENIMEYLANSNIHFNYNEKDPISKNLEYYRIKHDNLDINKYSYNKFYSPHSLEQFS